MLITLVPLMNDIGLETGWRILHGNPEFFTITKKFHNSLQGEDFHMTNIKQKLYKQVNSDFASFTHLEHDCVIVHDPQPLPLLKFYRKKQPWVWRCHIDISKPNEVLWDYLKQFIIRYDRVIVSSKKYKKADLPVNYNIIHPAIDPLSSKNQKLSEKEIEKFTKKFKIPTDKPLITQISRFDKWKDPEGVLKVYEILRKRVDCRLILCGSMAADDPEGLEIYEKIQSKARKYIDNGDVILLTLQSNILVNLLQTISDVIIQKSTREGFGLVVTEAMWKERPVIASNIGGIPLQITDKETGFLVDPYNLEEIAGRH